MPAKPPKSLKQRPSASAKLSPAAKSLATLAKGLAASGSRLEDRLWETQLNELIDPLLQDGGDDDLASALDHLFDADANGHDDLADLIESRAETTILSHQGTDYDVLLIAAPLLVWSRYAIAHGALPRSTVQTLTVQWQAHLLAGNARLAVCDYLFSPDQLPRSYADTWSLLRELGVAALSGRPLKIDPKGLPETNQFLSDTRFLLGAVAVPKGAPIFRWNEAGGDRATALSNWIAQASPSLEPLLTGAAFTLLGTDAYHSACRLADKEARPYSVKASVAFLQAQAGLEPASLRAIVGGFYDEQLEEYRVGLGPQSGEEIYHGVVWPLLGAEDEHMDIPGEIERVLKEEGVTQVVALDSRFPFEFCDDCGAPMYPNADGEPVHAELPETADAAPRVLH
jgi:hypothetical protein